jgi:hypothetical protein
MLPARTILEEPLLLYKGDSGQADAPLAHFRRTLQRMIEAD